MSTGRYELQEYIAGRWVTFASDPIKEFVIAEAKSMSQFEGRRFRAWDGKENKVVWAEKRQ